MSSVNDILQHLPFWSKLSEEEKQMAHDGASIRQYKRGQFIHGGSSDCLGMIYLISGEIRAYVLSEEGREITLFYLYDGSPCVFSASCVISQLTFETLISVERDCTMLIINSGTFALLADKNIHVRCFMYELLTERFSSVMWTMQQIMFMGFDRRLASFLVAEYDRTGKVTIKMTHEQLAQRVSSAREVVARMLKRFDADGLVEVKRGSIRLLDIDALRFMI